MAAGFACRLILEGCIAAIKHVSGVIIQLWQLSNTAQAYECDSAMFQMHPQHGKET
jgi:hypothetical protein